MVDDKLSVDWVPHHYQQSAIEFLKETGCANLWLDPGLGKTSICLAAHIEFMHHDKRPLLVIAPLRPASTVWPREIKKWKQFEHLSYTVLHGAEKNERFKNIHKRDVVIINYDGLKWLLTKLGNNNPFGCVILDESSMIKSGLTQRFKAVLKLTEKMSRIWLLTGTPASNSLMDVFSPQLVLDKGLTFGKWITKFRMAYFYNPSPFNWVLQPKAEERIYDALSVSSLRLSSKDYLDMPELIVNQVVVELPEEAKRVYLDLENKCMSEFLEGEVTAVNSGVAVMKMQQVANGGIYLDTDPDKPDAARVTKHIHNEKTEAAMEIVEDLGGKGAIIAYHFRHDLDRLKKAFPDAPVLGSGLSANELSRLVDGWNAGKYPVLLAHAQSAGHGLNLQEFGVAVIWYSLTYSRELFDQLNARIYRQGQRAKTVVVHMIVADDTVDLDVVQALERKGATQHELFTAILARQTSRKK